VIVKVAGFTSLTIISSTIFYGIVGPCEVYALHLGIAGRILLFMMSRKVTETDVKAVNTCGMTKAVLCSMYVIDGHQFYLCLNCNDWIQLKANIFDNI
jgi:hypothetical protein